MKEKPFPDFEKGNGLLPVVVQDAKSLDVLMFAYMNLEAWQKTLELGQMVYFSRSRQQLWHKGEESGNFQKVVELRLDCDNDTLLAKVEQVGGAACHTGRSSCFFKVVEDSCTLREEGTPLFDPSEVYDKSVD